MAAPEGEVTITVCPNGPLLVQGPARLQDVDGDPVVHDRTVIALCRCGRSALKPLCDGSHRLARFRDDAVAAAMTDVMRAPHEQQPDPDRVPEQLLLPAAGASSGARGVPPRVPSTDYRSGGRR